MFAMVCPPELDRDIIKTCVFMALMHHVRAKAGCSRTDRLPTSLLASCSVHTVKQFSTHTTVK